MTKVKSDFGLIFKLLLGIVIGIAAGLWANFTLMETPDSSTALGVLQVIGSIKHICNQFILFCVPLVIIGFIASSITRLGQNASQMLSLTLIIAYISSVGAAFFAIAVGYSVIPMLSVPTETSELLKFPAPLFVLNIPAVMPVITALVLAILLGFTALRTKSATMTSLLQEGENMISLVIKRIIIPLLPLLIATTFAELAFKGGLTTQLPVFLKVIVIALIGHFIWITLLYSIGGLIARRNPWQVVRHYVPAYLTAVGTMSSAATLPVALSCARKSRALSRNTVDFVIPMGATVHLCGSVLTETLFCMTIAFMLTGVMPGISTMVIFALLLGIFAIGAPGVPGGTVIASLGIVVSILGFNDTGTVLLIAIFALQDSFGTACNVTSDGAVALMVDGVFNSEAKDLQTGEADQA